MLLFQLRIVEAAELVALADEADNLLVIVLFALLTGTATATADLLEVVFAVRVGHLLGFPPSWHLDCFINN
jgi:hypothetical protein